MPPAVVGHCQRFHESVEVGEPDVAYRALCLPHRLDDGPGGRHREYAAHVVLVVEHALLEELVGPGRGLAGVDYDLAVLAAHFLPVGDLAAEDGFELLACEAVDRIGGVHDHRERIVGDYDLGGFEPDFGEFHLFAELDLTGGHRDVRGVLRQCGDSHAAAASGHYDFGVGMFIEVDFGEFLRERQQGVAPLDALGVAGRLQTEC